MNNWNRKFIAASLITAVSLAGTIALAEAQRDKAEPPQKEQGTPGHKKAPKKEAAQSADPRKGEPQRQAAPAQPPPRAQQQRGGQWQRGGQPQQQVQQQARGVQGQRLAQPQQQVRIGQQQQRLAQYGTQLDQQQRVGTQRAAQLQQQHRSSQYSFQLRYIAGLQQLQVGVTNSRNYNYSGDPYFYTPVQYRYLRGGRYYETNRYGADVLRQSVNYGYQEGHEAGQADRQDHWQFGYEDSYAYQDGNYGYRGFYVERADYNYYFREGFRRGYEDGFYGRYQYGRYESNHYSIQPPVLSVILSFQTIR